MEWLTMKFSRAVQAEGEWGAKGGRAWLAASVGLTLVAFALRVIFLDGQSLWYDEGISAAMAPRSFATITTAAAADIHPPLYYYLLHIWSSLAGTSEYSLRFLSVSTGVMLVPLLAKLGRRLAGPLVGLLAGWLSATSVLLVHYSQEARMYSLLMFLGVLLVWLAVRLGRSGSPFQTAVGLGLTSALTLYTHYLGPVLLLVPLMILLASREGRSCWRWWTGAMALAGAAWLPWALAVLFQVAGRSGPAIGESVAFHSYLARLVAVFAYGLSFDATLTGWAWWLVLILLAAALLWLRWSPSAAGPALVWLAVPVLVTYGLWLWRPLYNPVINPRFALPAAPAFYLWMAMGVTALARVASYLRHRFLPP